MALLPTRDHPCGVRWYLRYSLSYRDVADALPQDCKLRQSKYLNNIVEQDHRGIKRRVNPGLGFGSFKTAERTLQGYKVMHMLRKGHLEGAREAVSRRLRRRRDTVRLR